MSGGLVPYSEAGLSNIGTVEKPDSQPTTPERSDSMEIKILASGSAANCYLVSDGQTQLMIECGLSLPVIGKKSGFQLARVAGCLISHSHQDHCKAVKDLMRLGTDCYMSYETAEALDIVGHHRCHFLTPGNPFPLLIGTWTVRPFETKHDAPGSLGFLLVSQRGPRLVYLTDTPYSRYTFKKPTHIMIEANYSQEIIAENVETGTVDLAHKIRVMQNHMSLETVEAFLQAHDLSNVQGIWLLHLSNTNADEELFKRRIQRLTGKPVYFR